jgi:hypothetical protein
MAVVPRSCPVCGHPATLTDWGPHLPWIGVEGCGCSGFFVWAPLVRARPSPRTDASWLSFAKTPSGRQVIYQC